MGMGIGFIQQVLLVYEKYIENQVLSKEKSFQVLVFKCHHFQSYFN